MSIKKGTIPPRYDEAFKNGAVKTMTKQSRPSKEVAAELGICIDALKSWLKRAGFQPGAADRQNLSDKRQRELEAEIRSLRKQLAAFYGLDIAERQSGNFKSISNKLLKRGSPYIRKILHMASRVNISPTRYGEYLNTVMYEYYRRKREQKPYKSVMCAVMHKLANIIFAVMRDRKPFELRTPEEHIQRMISFHKTA